VKIEKTDQIEIRISNKGGFFTFFTFVTVFMVLMGLFLIVTLIIEGGLEALNFFIIAIILLWFSIVFGVGFTAYVMSTKELILNERGVKSKTILKEKFLDWSEVKDFGLSYAGQAGINEEILTHFICIFQKRYLNQKIPKERNLKVRK